LPRSYSALGSPKFLCHHEEARGGCCFSNSKKLWIASSRKALL
jgi:hypothetical protein